MRIGCLGVQPGRMIDQDAIRARYNALGPFLNDRRTDQVQSAYRKAIQPGNLSLCFIRGTEFSFRPESCNSLFSFKIMAIERCAARLCVPDGRFVRSGQKDAGPRAADLNRASS
jgi:hypothetical protein